MVKTLSDHIEVTPGTCGGKPRIAGTRIRVQDIAILTDAGNTPEGIVSDYPHITLADVYAALAYYHDHREEIDRQMKEDEEFVAEMMQEHPSIHTKNFVNQVEYL